MSLDRKDVRFKLDPCYHAALREICDVASVEIGDFVEGIVVREIERRLHEASELATRTARLGITGKRRESAGISGSGEDALGSRGSGR